MPGSAPLSSSTLHEKAIYLVEGRLYQVERLDFDNRKAYVEAVDCDYYTDAISHTRVTILDLFDTGQGGAEEAAPDSAELATDAARPAPGRRSHGEVHVVSRVVGFKKIKFYTNENVGSGELDLPEQQMHTSAYWVTLPSEVMTALPFATDAKRDGVVGMAYAMRSIAQLLLMCDRHDVGVSIDGDGSETPVLGGPASGPRPLAPEPQIFIFDNYPGGIGFSEPLFGMHEELLARTRDLIADCPCETGCPSCVGPAGDAGEQAKAVASSILAAVLGSR